MSGNHVAWYDPNPPFLQILQEQYRTEYYDPWHLRECYPQKYDVKIQECIRLANKPGTGWYSDDSDNSKQWLLQQAKIWQKRAAYIRHEQATQQSTQQAIQQGSSTSGQSDQDNPSIIQSNKSSLQEQMAQMMTMMTSMQTSLKALEAKIATPVQQPIQPAIESSTQPSTQPSTQLAIESSTQPNTQQSTQPTQKEKENETEKIAEKSMRSRKSITSNMGLLSRILHQASMPDDGKTSLNGSKAATISETTISSVPAYIRNPKNLEATGQG